VRSSVFLLAMAVAGCHGSKTAAPDATAAPTPSAAPAEQATLDAGMQDADAGSASLEDHARALAEAMARKDWSAVTRDFTLTMRVSLTPAQLDSVWTSIVAKSGARKSVLETRTDREGGFDIVLVTCQHERERLDVKVVYDADRKVAGLFIVPAWEPPSYANERTFEEKSVTVGAAPWALPATLTLPRDKRLAPAVVLVHGSGPNDRDESLGANRPFKDLAWGLASRGIAVLRYDKRSKVHAAAMAKAPRLTVKEESVDDALAAAALLRSTGGVDPKGIFVLGHSLGGELVPRIAAEDPKLAGAIVLAGSTRPLHEVMIEQTEYIAGLDGEVSAAEKKQIEAVRIEARKVEELKKSGRAESDAPILGAPPAYWLDILAYDAPAAAKKLTLPLLVLQGERDYQVTMKDFSNWKKALGKNKNARLVSFPGLNHLFITGEGKSGPSEYQLPGHVDEKVVEEIARFVSTRSSRP
jgi:dienelactone hydrolase